MNLTRWPCGRRAGQNSLLVATQLPNSAHGTGQHVPPGLATLSAVRRVGRVGGCNGLSRMYLELAGEDASPALALPTLAPQASKKTLGQ